MKMTSGVNINGDVYTRMAHIPAMVHHHLDSVLYRPGGGILLGASSLTGRYWSGSMWYFDVVEKAPDVESCSAGVELETGVNDMKLLSNNKVIIGTDTGKVQVYQLNEAEATLTRLHDQQAHDNVVTAVSVGASEARAISGSLDKSINVWDLEEMVETQSYRAHYAAVADVACHPTNADIFLSCGQEGRLLLWDTRKPKPASILDVSSLKSNAACLTWHPDKDFTFAVGSEGGALMMVDHRSKVTPTALQPHSRIIHRLAFNPKNSDWVASASDDCLVAVSDFSSNTVTWQSDRHTDFVRGLSWSLTEEHTLATCGWDFRVYTHCIKSKSMCEDEMDTMSPNPS